MLPCFRLIRCSILAFTMTAITLSATDLAFAQSYRSDEVNKSLSRQGAIAKRFVKNPSPDPAARQAFQAYFEEYFFPSMTQSTPEALGKIEKKRVELFKQFLYPANGATQTYLSGKAKEFAKRIVFKRGYHPSVKLNALLILGQLDSVYTGESGEPTPDAEANELLCRVISTAGREARIPQFMLATALVGLERHTRFYSKLPKQNQALTVKTLGRLVTTDKLAGEYDKDVRDWIYRKASRALANLGTAGPNGAYFKAIGKRVADERIATETRVAMAGMLKELKAEPGSIRATSVIKAILSLTSSVGEAERASAEEFEELQLRGGRNRSTSPSRKKTARRYREEEGRLVMERREVLALFTNLQKGIQAVAAQAKGPDQERLAAIDQALGQVIRDIIDKEMIDLNVADSIKRMADAIAEATGDGDAQADADDLGL